MELFEIHYGGIVFIEANSPEEAKEIFETKHSDLLLNWMFNEDDECFIADGDGLRKHNDEKKDSFSRTR